MNENKRRTKALKETSVIARGIFDLAENHNCKGINVVVIETINAMARSMFKEFFKVVDNMGINDAAKRYGVCSETIRNKIVELNLSPQQPVNEPKTKMLPKDTIRALDKYYGISPGVELDEIGL